MRTITHHSVPGKADTVTVEAVGDPGAGGAPVEYHLSWSEPVQGGSYSSLQTTKLRFQSRPVPEGINGITNEALLAVVLDRLQAFQQGPFPCQENREAIRSVFEALYWLQKRTVVRMERNVEGELKP